jgi:RimJ/RimL family protein N-acetyltransferase
MPATIAGMHMGPELETPRLLLRRWRPDDITALARLNADPEVMEYFPARLSLEETRALVDRIEAGFEANGYGLWAVEVSDGGDIVGLVGLSPVGAPYPFAPAVEVAWRLARHAWGKGYATEAARASVRFGFDTLALDEIVALTSVLNGRSRRVMERIGMTRDPRDDFDHPKVPEGHRLRPHVLYRLRRIAAT